MILADKGHLPAEMQPRKGPLVAAPDGPRRPLWPTPGQASSDILTRVQPSCPSPPRISPQEDSVAAKFADVGRVGDAVHGRQAAQGVPAVCSGVQGPEQGQRSPAPGKHPLDLEHPRLRHAQGTPLPHHVPGPNGVPPGPAHPARRRPAGSRQEAQDSEEHIGGKALQGA